MFFIFFIFRHVCVPYKTQRLIGNGIRYRQFKFLWQTEFAYRLHMGRSLPRRRLIAQGKYGSLQ